MLTADGTRLEDSGLMYCRKHAGTWEADESAIDRLCDMVASDDDDAALWADTGIFPCDPTPLLYAAGGES